MTDLHPLKPAHLLAVVGLALIVGGCGESTDQPRDDTPAGTTQTDGDTSDATRADPIANAKSGPARWTMSRFDTAMRGRIEGQLVLPLQRAWQLRSDYAFTATAAADQGFVFVGNEMGELLAVDLATGEKRWTYVTGDERTLAGIEAPTAVADGLVFVGSTDWHVHAVRIEDGSLAWKFETGDKIASAIVPVEAPDGSGTWIIFGSDDNFLYCLEAKTGRKVWAYETDEFVRGGPAVADGMVVVGGCDEILHLVALDDGSPIAKINVETQVATNVAIADGHAYFGTQGNYFMAADLKEHKLLWRYRQRPQPFLSAAAIDANRIIFGGSDRRLHCVDRYTGESLWTFTTRNDVQGSPVVIGEHVVFGSTDGRLYVLRVSDGQMLQEIELGGQLIASPIIVGGKVIIGTDNGRNSVLVALRSGEGP